MTSASTLTAPPVSEKTGRMERPSPAIHSGVHAAMKQHLIEQADYQRWASAELFKSLDLLSDEQRRAHLGLFFQNIHHTLDHILAATRNWTARLHGEFDRVTPYDTTLYADWNELKSAMLEEFGQLGAWLSAQSPDWLAHTVEYPGPDGAARRIRVHDALMQVMLHAVHHRGQVSAACTRLGAPCPEMDFVFYLRRKG